MAAERNTKIAFGNTGNRQFFAVKREFCAFLRGKKSVFLFLAVFLPLCLGFSALDGSEIPYSNLYQHISLDFEDASLKDVLKIFSQQAGMNFIAAKDVEDINLTLYLDNVTVKQALDNLLSANNLIYELEPGSNLFVVKKNLLSAVRTTTKVFYLKYAHVPGSGLEQGAGGADSGSTDGGEVKSNVVEVLKTVLSEYGVIDVDIRTNGLIITDVPEKFLVIEEVIAKLDVPLPQVMIEVEMLDVNKSDTELLGFNHGGDSGTRVFGLDIDGTRNTKFPHNDVSDPGFTDRKFSFSEFTFFDADLALDFLKTQTDTKFLARPRILVLSNETAEIKITTNESIGVTVTKSTAGDNTSTTAAERTKTGVSLRVTPQVNLETGEISMFVKPVVTEATDGQQYIIDAESYQFKDPEERSTSSTIRVKDGETVMLGGLIRSRKTDSRNKLFILADIPILGVLFRNKDVEQVDRELVVFLTPHILTDNSISLAKTYAPSGLTLGSGREQVSLKKQAASGRDLEIEKMLEQYETTDDSVIDKLLEQYEIP